MISLDNTEIAFADKSDRELRFAYLLFRALRNIRLVNAATALALAALRIGLPVASLVRSTIFRIFCGGETIAECGGLLAELKKRNVRAILTYSAEAKESEKEFDASMEETLRTIDAVKSDPEIPFVVFKVTSLGRFAMLEQMQRGEKEPDEFGGVRRRVERLCEAAAGAGLKIVIDAEESWIQDPIDALAGEMMKKHNGTDAVVYNTFQLYRTDRLQFLKDSHRKSQQEGYVLGAKPVRGAYLEKERERARKLNYPSPIHATKDETDRDYDEAINYIVRHLDGIRLLMGTHNKESTLSLARLMERHGIARNDPRIFCAQLMGMSDYITFNMAHAGYNVIKYVPYGPVRDVIPYLVRRARENSSIQGQMGRELQLIGEEIKRRRQGVKAGSA